MMKILKILLWLILISSFLYGKDIEINRRLICLYNSLQKENSVFNNIHYRLEVILNYYGYYCDYYDINKLPKNSNKYLGIVYWASSQTIKSPLNFYNWLIMNKKKNKKIILIGDLPKKSPKKDYSKKVNEILKKNFGFYFHGYWYNDPTKIKILKKSKIFDFEIPLTRLTVSDFNDIRIIDKKIKPLLVLQYNDNNLKLTSIPVFIAPWGAYCFGNKIFYYKKGIKRWIINPFKFVEMTFNTDYPIPDTTTIDGKRILYLHIDGDGVNSLSEVILGKTCGEVWYEKIGKGFPKLKTGVSFIAGDIDPRYAGSKRSQKVAREIYALPNVEPASHTYTHPLSWSKAIVVYEKKGEKEQGAIYEHIKALRAKGGKLNHYFEIVGSIKYLDRFTPPGKKVKVLYWSGDCMPTKKDLEIVNENHLLAFNGGDTFFDLKHNSYSYVMPLGRDVDGLKQIYSSGSNENVYTNLWTSNFWGFAGVVETYDRTGYPIRLKPIDVYYHFYSMEKFASFNALLRVYRYVLKKKNLINIFPSQFIRIAKNFYTVKIFKEGNNKYKIVGCKYLKEFRCQGRVKVKKLANIKAIHYNKRLNVTYITVGKKNYAELIILK